MFDYDKMEEIRSEKGITKKSIADKLGKTQSILQDWKRGKSKPSKEQLQIVAEILDTTVAYLTGETEEKTPAVSGGGRDYSFIAELSSDELEQVRRYAEFLMSQRNG